MSHYYKHCRDNITERMGRNYIYWFLYSFVSCIVMYFVPQYAYSMTCADSSGRTEGVWAIGFVGFCAMVMVHHVQVLIEMRHHSFFMICIAIISFLLFMPMTVYFNDVIPGGMMYLTTFTEIMHGPVFWLSLTFVCGLILLPFYGIHCIWHLLTYP
jgi:hypothetical protein